MEKWEDYEQSVASVLADSASSNGKWDIHSKDGGGIIVETSAKMFNNIKNQDKQFLHIHVPIPSNFS